MARTATEAFVSTPSVPCADDKARFTFRSPSYSSARNEIRCFSLNAASRFLVTLRWEIAMLIPHASPSNLRAFPGNRGSLLRSINRTVSKTTSTKPCLSTRGYSSFDKCSTRPSGAVMSIACHVPLLGIRNPHLVRKERQRAREGSDSQHGNNPFISKPGIASHIGL